MKNLCCNNTLLIFWDYSSYVSRTMPYSIFLPYTQWNKSSLNAPNFRTWYRTVKWWFKFKKILFGIFNPMLRSLFFSKNENYPGYSLNALNLKPKENNILGHSKKPVTKTLILIIFTLFPFRGLLWIPPVIIQVSPHVLDCRCFCNA